MIKNIKRTKEMRLDELIKYVWDNELKADNRLLRFESQVGSVVEVDMSGQVRVYGQHYGNELFTLEVEEEITEDTEFENLIWFDLKGNIHISRESNIAKIITFNDLCKKIYVYHNDEFSKIWECE